MANDIRNDNFIFPSRHVPDCFVNIQVMKNLDILINTIGDVDSIINLLINKNRSIVKEYKGYLDMIYGYKKGT